MKKYLSLLLMLVLLLAGSALADGEELIKNGDFSKLDASGLPSEWSRGMWFTDAGISNLYVDEGIDGNCVAVVNADENDARWEQNVSVEPNSIYCFSAKVRAKDCTEDGYGATISFAGTFSYSESLFDTDGEWKELKVYGETGDNQRDITVMLRIGGYGSLNTGYAWFDDVSCVKVEQAPGGAIVLPLATSDNSSSSVSEETDDDDEPVRHTEEYLLMTCLYALLVLALSRRSGRFTKIGRENTGRMILIWGLAIAAIVRVIISIRVRGYNTDIGCFSGWSERMYSEGFTKFYADDYFCDYPPGYMLALWLPAAIRNLFNLDYLGPVHLVLLKGIPLICDILGALLIFDYAKKNKWDLRPAAIFALLYAFNPMVIVDSAAWGQIDSVFTLFVVLCALKASEDKYIGSLISFAIAMLVKPQAMLFAPLGLIAIIVNLIRAKDKQLTSRFIKGVAAAVGVIYLFGFAFTVRNAANIGNAIVRPIEWLISLYGGTMGSYAYITINSLNLYDLLNLNWTQMTAVPAWSTFAWIMFAFSYLYSIFLYARSKDKKHILLCGGLLITLIFTFGPMIHERYIFPAVLLLMLAYVYDRDKRLLLSITVMTCTIALNEILVLQGGMGSGNYGHLQSREQWLNATLSAINVLNALFLIWTAADICGIFTGEKHVIALKPEKPETETVIEHEPATHIMGIKRGEVLFMAVVTVVYSIVAFTNLGVTKAPQTCWVSSQSDEMVTFDLGDVKEYHMLYYGEICDSNFTVELSNDGVNWSDSEYALYSQGDIFRWIMFVPRDEDNEVIYGDNSESSDGNPVIVYAASGDDHPFQKSRYIRITAQSAGLRLAEFGFRDRDDALLPIVGVSRAGGLEEFKTDPQLLTDEQDTVPVFPSYLNSSYFDEIYHARTAYELLHGMSVYEWTHPPLGKVLMMVGVQIFGMTPFGWRFMGTFVGVLMVPLMYLLVRQLTKSKELSAVAMLMMALDAMHFTQTRIATIDSYSVFWIMLEYLFMFRYIQMDWKQVSLRKSYITLGLCGVTMGIACATKWIGIYSAVGLAILFFWKIIYEYMNNKTMRTAYTKRILQTGVFCVAFFIVIPLLIYYLSYFRQLRYEGVSTIFDMFKGRWVKRVIELQQSMLGYHAGLGGDTHFFRSPWYQWPIIWWPMWYYSGTEFMPEGMISSISCMGNPAVWWFGLIGLIFVLIAAAWLRKAPKNYLIVLIGFASQFLPWVLVPRSTFIYHYFASVPFIIICGMLLFDELRKRDPKSFKIASIALITIAAVLFIAFYPLESSMPAMRSYAKYLRWFRWYNY